MTKLTSNHIQNIELVKKAAQETYPDNKVLADLAFVQAILESDLQENMESHKGKGGSNLAVEYCNLFGIKPGKIVKKGTKPPDGIVNLMTTEYEHGQPVHIPQPFLANNSIEDSFKQRKELLEGLSRYENLKAAKTFEEVAHLIYKDGYATDPNYPNELLAVHKKYSS